jgi:hypothetical protein
MNIKINYSVFAKTIHQERLERVYRGDSVLVAESVANALSQILQCGISTRVSEKLLQNQNVVLVEVDCKWEEDKFQGNLKETFSNE